MPEFRVTRANGTEDIIVSDSVEGAVRDAGAGSVAEPVEESEDETEDDDE